MKLLLILLFIFSSHLLGAQQKWNYPPTPKIPLYDTIFDKVIKNDYHWMEKYDSPGFLDGVKAQNKFTNSVKQLIPAQEEGDSNRH